MEMKYHINDRGEPGICHAVYKCRFGRDADQHFDTVDEARTAYEKEKVNELFPNGIEKDGLGRRELNKLVKYTDDQEILLQGVETGSPRIRASILSNRNTNADVLRKLYETVKDGKGAAIERREITAHRNYPIEDMSNEEFLNAVKERTKLSYTMRSEMFKDNGLGEQHKESLMKFGAAEAIDAASNKNNKLSAETRYELLTKDKETKLLALRSGKLPASEIKQLDTEEYNNVALYGNKIEHPAHLDEITVTALSGKHGDDVSRRALEKVIHNNNLSERAISAIVRSNFNSKYDQDYSEGINKALYNLPHISDSAKNVLISRSPEVERLKNIEQIAAKVGGMSKLKERIIKNYDEKSAGTSYRKVYVSFDKDELNKLGMGKDEVLTLMNRQAWNADFKYDEESGVFVGGIDSSG